MSTLGRLLFIEVSFCDRNVTNKMEVLSIRYLEVLIMGLSSLALDLRPFIRICGEQ